MSNSIKDKIEEYERKIYDLQQLLEISRALNSSLDYRYLIQAMLDMCLAQAQTMQAGLFLLPDEQSSHLELIDEIRGLELQERPGGYKISLRAPLAHYLEKNPIAAAMDELYQQVSDTAAQDLLEKLGAKLIVPMRVRRRLIGLMILGEKLAKEGYTEMQRNFFTDLASLSAIAVNNARLYERATVDMMTGLKNRAYFQESLEEHRIRAIEEKVPLALMISDIDHFKKINDTYGHQVGDQVLKKAADILLSCCRSSDLASRYGGEEFCLTMPYTDAKGALQMGEKFRQQIESATIECDNRTIQVTISAGIAIIDPQLDADSNRSILERADQALYICKRSGRNQVKIRSRETDSAETIYRAEKNYA